MLTGIFHGDVSHTRDVLPVIQLDSGVWNGVPVQRRIERNEKLVNSRPHEANVFLLRLELAIFAGLTHVFGDHILGRVGESRGGGEGFGAYF